jgi:hypothetical protein
MICNFPSCSICQCEEADVREFKIKKFSITPLDPFTLEARIKP